MNAWDRKDDALAILDNLPLGALVLCRDLKVLYWNTILEEWTGILRNDIVGQPVADFFPHLGNARFTDRIALLFEGGPPAIFSSQLHRSFIPSCLPDGSERVQHTTATPLPHADGFHALLSIQDVTDLTRLAKNARALHAQAQREIDERKKAEKQLRLAASVFASTSEGIVVTDPQGTIVSVNPAFEEITGYRAAEAIGTTVCVLRSKLEDQEFYRHLWERLQQDGYWKGETWDRRKSGEEYPIELTISAIKDDDGSIRQFATIFRDITERKRMEDQLRDLSMRDGLTGIFNRRTFDVEIEREWRRATRILRPFSVILIDIDYFKRFNDTYGHPAGDACLKRVADVIESSVNRAGDLTSRYGGEEFVVLLPMTSSADAIRIGEKIRRDVESLAIAHRGSKAASVVTVSIGVGTVLPSRDTSPSAVLRLADQALYAAKRGGRNRVVCHDESATASQAC